MLISLWEAGRRLGITKSRVWKLIQTGRLKARRLGDASNAPYLIDDKDLKAVEIRKPGRPWADDHKRSNAYLRRKRRDAKNK